MPAYEVVTLGLSQAPEGRRIFPRMSVKENLEMGAFSRKGQDLKADFDRVYDLFPRAEASASRSRAARSRAASSRCWPWAAR